MGLFEIVEKVGEVAYRLNLPPQLGHVHNVFHMYAQEVHIRSITCATLQRHSTSGDSYDQGMLGEAL